MAAPLATPPLPLRTPSAPASTFDIVGAYRSNLLADPDLTMPVAAIEALVQALAESQASTIAETLLILETHTATLKRSIPNPISLSAGTDLFRRYLYTTVEKPGAAGDFETIRTHLLTNGREFVRRAKESRDTIARSASRFVRDGSTILTNGGSRVVGALLKNAAEQSASRSSIRFRVIYVLPASSSASDTPPAEGAAIISALRARGVPVAAIPESAVAYCLQQVTMVLVGAEGVVESGGIISRLGTYQMAMLARAERKPLYVVAESHKFVRLYPLGQFDLPVAQSIVQFMVGEEGREEVVETERGAVVGSEDGVHVDEGVEMGAADDVNAKIQRRLQTELTRKSDAVDFTPPELIDAIITESGVRTPSAVSEELIKIWF